MTNYEVTFIVDPVLSADEIQATAQTYVDLLRNEGCNIVHVDEMGLRQLAYNINKRQSGVYYCVEFETPKADFLTGMELSLRRDERIMRFLTARLDKYGMKFNTDKRNGLIGKKKATRRNATVAMTVTIAMPNHKNGIEIEGMSAATIKDKDEKKIQTDATKMPNKSGKHLRPNLPKCLHRSQLKCHYSL